LESNNGRWFEIENIRISKTGKGELDEMSRQLIEEATSKEDREKKKRVWRKFIKYLEERKIVEVSPEAVVGYIACRIYREGVSYQVIAGEKSAIMMIIKVVSGEDWSNNVLIRLAMRGASKLRPVEARYKEMWDIRMVYEYYRSEGGDINKKRRESIDLRTKAIILIRASTAGRNKDIARIARSSVRRTEKGVQFQLYGWKTMTTGVVQTLSKPFILEYMEDERICAARTLLKYLERNAKHYESQKCKHNDVWIYYNKPEAVKHTTLAKDTRDVMKEMGIDTKVYGAATIRHAAISYWIKEGFTMEEVARRTGHRSMNVIVFYYDKSQAKDLMRELEKKTKKAVEEEDEEESEEEVEEELVQEM